MEDLPDISHLTPEERRIIEEVVIRQKREEEKENEIMRRKQDEVQVLEETIRARSEKHKKAGVELNATCQVCMKTKFADGIGHNCNYCHIRCCARCGAKITLRSRREIWVCIVCRKKQEVLTMTKAGLGTVDNAMLPMRMQEDMQVGGPPGLLDQTQDKRPKLERAHSAAEKENLPLLQRSGSLLKRQYSQQEQVPRRVSTSDSGVEMSVSPHSRSLPTPQVVGSYPIPKSLRHHTFGPDETSLFRSEIDGLMREHQKNYPRHRPIYQDQNSDFAMAYGQPGTETGPSRGPVHPSQQHTVVHQAQGTHPSQSAVAGQSTLQQQRSYSSSEEERSTPECGSDEPDESEKGKEYYPKMDGPMAVSKDTRTKKNATHNGQLSITSTINIEFNGNHQPREPRKELNTIVRRSFRRNGDEWRADSRRFTERRGKKTVRFYGGTNIGRHQEDDWSWEVADHCRQGSQDSATKDSGIDTSSTFTSSEESNRGELPKHPLSWQVSRDGQKVIGHMVLRKSLGSETGTSILGLKVVGGILLEDGSRGAVIEKVKKGSTADVDGHLRPGDEVLEWNNRSLQGRSFKDVYEIIAESRQESQVELIVSRNLSAALAPSTTTMTTSTIMVGQQQQQQKQLQQQQLHQQRLPVTSMSVPSRRITSQTQWRTKQDSISSPQQPHHKDYMIFRIPGLKKCILWELYDARREKPSVLVTSPGSPDLNAQGRVRHGRRATTGNVNVGGDLQVKLAFDPVALQLLVTVICASALSPRPDGQPRNPYAKIFLLPDRSEKSKRRTKTLANTNDPKWNQTFVYNGIRSSELRKRALEITVWDYGRYDANDFLGEVVIELAVAPLDDEIEWHPLTIHAEHRHYQEAEDMVITPVDCHLSPPSTTSRLSDSDTSECDITDCDVSREQRRTADGASISSIGSSSRFHNMPSNYKRHYSSPPPERELCVDGEHRSRRDMSPQGRKRAALMVSRDHPASISGYQTYRKDDIHRGMMGHRSHSAAPMDSPSVRYRGRSQSPTGHRSLSPPEHRSMPYSHSYMPRFGSRSATATPTGSPKKRQLPQIPAALKDRVTHDFEDRAKFMRHRNRPGHTTYRSTGMGGWERHYSGLSDSDLPSMGHDPLSLPHSNAHRLHRPRRGHLSPDKDVLGDLGDSDMESIASVTSSAFSTQSERPRGSRGLIEYSGQSGSYEKPTRHQTTDNGHDEQHTGKRGQFIRSLSNTDAPPDEKVDGSLSDTAVSHVDDASRRDRKSSPGSKSGSGSSSGGGSAVQYQTGLGKKSNSTSQLSATGGTCVGEEGRKRRLGFGKKGKSSFTVHRSEEVLPEDTASGRSGRQASSASSDGEGSGDGDRSVHRPIKPWSPSLRLASETGQLRDFIEDLGPAQVVGRQALGAGHLGAIQLSLSNTKGYLEVEIIRAKDLKSKIGSKAIPASYVKVYLMNGKKCIEKAKTSTARRTLDPFYQESLAFRENYRGCILQITVWGDYGRFEGKKVFMGLAQIVLDDLNLNQMVFGWYKLFDATLLVSGPSTLALSRRSSATSLESLKSLRIDEVSSERETEEKRSARFLDVDER
ncbi:PREDICTED: regulating synaptic membrane exocytosis protein 2 isoform X7 [Polistes canadensis]|uniref:regulating synaptic membrane exocytosis protein 2 isoform X7 n=1 Tax=Polistes canadensis TaxID=91411 RepID=UPI000718E3B7|nr:PREDICTED: regulating synaptic membrane exocytosis protein 2 isoform X7 [Polistes canadensis]